MQIKREEHQYYTDLLPLYNDIISAYRLSGASVEGQGDSLELFKISRDIAVAIAGFQRDINRMEYQYQALRSNRASIRSRSAEAEKALTGFIADLEDRQEALYDLVYEYYRARAGIDAENAVLISSPAVISQTPAVTPAPAPAPAETPVPSISYAFVIVAFVGCIVVSVAMAFLVATVKKYIPEKEPAVK